MWYMDPIYKRPLISVIVPVFNSAATIDRCVRSLLSQTYSNLEVILIDDGSKDESLLICKNYAEFDERVVVLSQENGGAGAARNSGLRVMHGDFVGFCDSDDYVEPTMYEHLFEALVQNGADVSCCGRSDHYDLVVSPGLCPNEREAVSGIDALRKIFVYDGMDFAPWDKLFSRSIWGATLFPEGRICEDIGCLYNVFKKAKTVALINERLYHYCHRISSASEIGLGPRVFDFQHYAGIIYRDVIEEIPSLEPLAAKFRIKSLLYTIGFIYRATKKEYKPYRGKLYSFVREVRFFFPKMGKKEKIISFLYTTHALRCLRPVYYLYQIMSGKKRRKAQQES